MLTTCGRPQGEGVGLVLCGQGDQNLNFLVDVLNR